MLDVGPGARDAKSDLDGPRSLGDRTGQTTAWRYAGSQPAILG